MSQPQDEQSQDQPACAPQPATAEKRKHRKRKEPSRSAETPSEIKRQRRGNNGAVKAVFSNCDFDRENPADSPSVTLSGEATHSDTGILIFPDRLSLSNARGYRMAKSTHGVGAAGSWYFEVRLSDRLRGGNFRVGWSLILGEPHAPVGYDEYSFSYADVTGNSFHCSRGYAYGDPFAAGDVVGCLLELGAADDSEAGMEQHQHKYPRLREGVYNVSLTWSSASRITFFKNGVSQGPAFAGLYHGKYYPAVSLFKTVTDDNSAACFVDFAPAFLPAQSRPVSDIAGPAAASGRGESKIYLEEADE